MAKRMLTLQKTLVLCFIGGQFIGVQTYSADMETQIRSETVLHASYDPISRPVEQTHIKCGLSILAIDELNLKDQKLTMAGWLTFEWHDHRLTWDKAARNDTEYIFTKPGYIWKPELVIDNSLSATSGSEGLTDLDVIANPNLILRMKYDGTIDWEPPKLISVHCEVDVTYYPYDRQKCAVEIVSWAYTYDEVVLDHLFEKVNLEDFERHGEWRVSHTEIEDKNLTEHLPGGTVRIYPQLDFWFFLVRRTEFYNLNVMMPIILTSLMVILVFLVPIHTGEKVSYVLTLFLALAVLLTIVAESLPPTSITVSVLGLYLGIVLILGGFATFLTVFILVIYHKEGEPDPKLFIVRFTACAAKVSRMKMPDIRGESSMSDNRVEPLQPVTDTTSLDTLDLTTAKGEKINSDEKKKTSIDNSEDEPLTWQSLAIVLDRFCFIAFSALTLVMNIAFVIALTFGGNTGGYK